MTDQPLKGMIYTDKAPKIKVATKGGELTTQDSLETIQPALISTLTPTAAFGLGYKWGYLDSAKQQVSAIKFDRPADGNNSDGD